MFELSDACIFPQVLSMTYIVPSNDEEKSSLFYPMHIEDIFRSCGLIVYKISKNYISNILKTFHRHQELRHQRCWKFFSPFSLY